MISAPLRSLASTTTVAAASPAMIRLRAGKRHGAGSTPGAYSDTIRPCSPDPPGQLGVCGRVDPVDAAAEHGNRRPACLQRAPVRLAVDPTGQAAHYDEAGSCELPAEHPSHGGAVRRAGARADDGDGRPFEQHRILVSSDEQPDRWIEDRGQAARKGRFGAAQPADALRLDRDEVSPFVELAGEPPEPRRSRLRHEVRSGLGRERGNGELAHASSSLGTR